MNKLIGKHIDIIQNHTKVHSYSDRLILISKALFNSFVNNEDGNHVSHLGDLTNVLAL